MIKSFCTTTLVLFLLTGTGKLYADSPVTSTVFYSSYLDEAMVNTALNSGTITEEIANYLLDDKNPIDYKAAVINALGWDYNGKNNADTFKKHLVKKYGYIDADKMKADDLMCLGYLMAMDNYDDVSTALTFMNAAKAKSRDSFTIHMIWSIVYGQSVFEDNWCEIWRGTRDVLRNDDLDRDMKTSAAQLIVDYMILYRDYCGSASTYEEDK